MIGNDIIDLAEAKVKSSWKRRGFLEKIFTEEEQSFILKSDYPETMVWLFWSMKESAYKAYLQQNKKFLFHPLKFNCTVLHQVNYNYDGEVWIENQKYITHSCISNKFISTIALKENSGGSNILNDYIKFSDKNYKTQQQEIYSALVKKFTETANRHLINLEIKKDEFGIPHLYGNDLLINCSISLSHHGEYGAYAFQI